MNKNIGIIVIGGHVQGLGIVRVLGKLGYRIVLLDNTNINLARHSKYSSEFIKYKQGKLLEKLLELGRLSRYNKYILLSTNDAHVKVLSRNKDVLSKYFIVGADNWESVEKCYNKRLTYNIALKVGIPIATTYMLDTLTEVENLDIDFPCIIKPAIMHSFYNHFKKKVFVCNNRYELIENYKKAVSVVPGNEIIIQSIINSDSDGYYSVCFLYDRNQEILFLTGRRARQHPPAFGHATTFAQVVDSDKLVSLSKIILNEIGYQGLCEVEFMYDNTRKEYVFLEINPRTWKWHTIAVKANVNLLEDYINLLIDKPLIGKKQILKASFRHLVTDIPTVLRYKMKNIFKRYPKYPVQYAVWDIKDIKPFIFELLYLPILIIKR